MPAIVEFCNTAPKEVFENGTSVVLLFDLFSGAFSDSPWKRGGIRSRTGRIHDGVSFAGEERLIAIPGWHGNRAGQSNESGKLLEVKGK